MANPPKSFWDNAPPNLVRQLMETNEIMNDVVFKPAGTTSGRFSVSGTSHMAIGDQQINGNFYSLFPVDWSIDKLYRWNPVEGLKAPESVLLHESYAADFLLNPNQFIDTRNLKEITLYGNVESNYTLIIAETERDAHQTIDRLRELGVEGNFKAVPPVSPKIQDAMRGTAFRFVVIRPKDISHSKWPFLFSTLLAGLNPMNRKPFKHEPVLWLVAQPTGDEEDQIEKVVGMKICHWGVHQRAVHKDDKVLAFGDGYERFAKAKMIEVLEM